jgi:hypothetical protein
MKFFSFDRYRMQARLSFAGMGTYGKGLVACLSIYLQAATTAGFC